MSKGTKDSLTYTPHHVPSQAIVTGQGQFIYLTVRSGNAHKWYVDREILALVRVVRKLKKKLREDEFLMIREVWFDDAHGGYVAYIDLIHDQNKLPSIPPEEIRRALHDGETWPDGQSITVGIRIIPEYENSDHFFPIADQYYKALGWKDSLNSPNNNARLGEWKISQ